VGHELDQLRSEGFDVRPYQADTLAQDLSAGLIVGRCADRMEFGPRALGNRSILMDPSDGSRVHYLNRRVKTRDFWMPFAPVLMQDDAAEYLATSNAADYSFMTIACDTKPAARREAFAALHPYDLTARPQILAREANEPLADAIAAFRSFTGKGILLNTSLNLHGDPICNTAAEAAALLRGGNLDRLQLQNFYIAPTS